MKTLINLTPHALVVLAGEQRVEIQPSGSVPGVRADFCAAMDEKLRTPKRVARYMVEYGESEPKPAFSSYSKDAGDDGNEDGAWGSSTSDGWRVD